MLLFTLTVAFIALLYLRYLVFKRKYKDIEKIPGPPANFLMGNISEFGTNTVDLFRNIHRIISTYGKLVRIWRGPFHLQLLITDPNIAESILSSNVLIKKSSPYTIFEDFLGGGILLNSGDEWRKHRKLFTPAFHFKILDQFSDTFHRSSKSLIRNLKNECHNPVDVYPHVAMYALEAICESSMGMKLDIHQESHNAYIQALETYLSICIMRFFSFLRRFDIIFQFTEDHKKVKRCMEIINNATNDVIRRRGQLIKDTKHILPDDMGIKHKRVFIDTLFETNQLSEKEIIIAVNSFLFAGHDTVSSGISYALYEIAKHPNVQQLLLEEIHGVVGLDNNSEITTYHINEMTYLDRVFKESMRLHPPVVMFERELTEDILLDGKNIPKGTVVAFYPYSQHRSKDLFPDPEKFDPDRFLPENASRRHPYAYIPFSAGPRNCIGQKYAMINAKVAIANVIRNFIMKPVEPEHIPIPGFDGIMKPTNGLPILMKPRM